jgi:demethylmenaquinone methyltransferase/2-methoxy-6-polyprenyl-1,4-benzoquinol methylase
VFAAIYAFYSGRVLPAVGGAVSGDPEAYRYLPESVRKFPAPDRLAEMMRAAGFTAVRYERMTAGIVALHTGTAA